jgi:hypothetical protein
MLLMAITIKGYMLPMVDESEFVYVKIPKLNQSDEKVHVNPEGVLVVPTFLTEEIKWNAENLKHYKAMEVFDIHI